MTTLPVGLDVVWSTKKLDLPGARRQSLYHPVDLIRFVAGGADLVESVWHVLKNQTCIADVTAVKIYLSYDHITVQSSVEALSISLDTHLTGNKLRSMCLSQLWIMFHRQAQIKIWNSSGTQTHQAVLLPVVQPMACPSSADDSLQLVGFYPNDLIDTFVSEKCNEIRWIPHKKGWELLHRDLPPKTETLSAQLHSPARWEDGDIKCLKRG